MALKMVSEHLTDRAAIEGFEREACAASALNHANICTIYEIDEVDGKPFALPLKPILAKERDEALEFGIADTLVAKSNIRGSVGPSAGGSALPNILSCAGQAP